MKMNVNDRQREVAKYIALETRIERGRQLQSKAVFEMCANMFMRKKISTTNFKIEEQDPRLVESH